MSVIYKKDGKYFSSNTYTTHTGEHFESDWVEDINKATVFYSLPYYKIHALLKDAERLEAYEERKVYLKNVS